MNKLSLLLVLFFTFSIANGQKRESESSQYQNAASKLLSSEGTLTIGGYAQIDYNQPFGNDARNNGTLDVHRLVMLFGYRFNDRTTFVTEIEFEHVKEVFVEQAFLEYKISNSINFRGGLILIPMGIINEYHEPPSFNGVERPLVDSYISPTTWREIGFGLNGNIISASLKYQAYIVNGFNGYDGEAHLGGKNGLRKGRQKGAESFISSPNFSSRIEFYGLRGLNLGLSGYLGNTQSTMFDGIDKNNNSSMASADSSVVGIRMIGLDARYSMKGLRLRGQYYFTGLTNTESYNLFTSDAGQPNDLGSSMTGFYIEAGYNVLNSTMDISSELVPFVRYEKYNTHHMVDGNLSMNSDYNNTIVTAGLGWKMASGAMLKSDFQFLKNESGTSTSIFNMGIGIMF